MLLNFIQATNDFIPPQTTTVSLWDGRKITGYPNPKAFLNIGAAMNYPFPPNELKKYIEGLLSIDKFKDDLKKKDTSKLHGISNIHVSIFGHTHDFNDCYEAIAYIIRLIANKFGLLTAIDDEILTELNSSIMDIYDSSIFPRIFLELSLIKYLELDQQFGVTFSDPTTKRAIILKFIDIAKNNLPKECQIIKDFGDGQEGSTGSITYVLPDKPPITKYGTIRKLPYVGIMLESNTTPEDLLTPPPGYFSVGNVARIIKEIFFNKYQSFDDLVAQYPPLTNAQV